MKKKWAAGKLMKKKFVAKISAFFLVVIMFFPTAAFAAESAVSVRITVPDTHRIRLEIGEHGSVMVGEVTYTGIQEIYVDRLAEMSYKLQSEEKYEIDTVTYDGENVTDQLHEQVYQAPPVNKDDIVLKVTFREKDQSHSSSSGMQGGGDLESAGVKTGDTAPVGTWISVLILSIVIVAVCTAFKKKCKN